ncbi:MAG: hypothetical protein EBU12_08770 [Microbacteriaceae bacterium]|nr:hypothetical protein [Microbacteriaceae bacterium]
MAKQTFTTGQVLTAAQMTSLQQTAMGGGSPSVKTTSYVLVAADAGTVIQMNAAGSTTITVNTSLFSAGDSVQIQNIGAGTCTITAGTATVNTAGSLALSQWEGGFLYFTSASSAIFFDVVQSSGMTNPMTTTGDTIYSSSGSTPARLGIGSTGQVLTVAGGVPTWAAPAGASGPTFYAYASGTAQTITAATWTKVQYKSELWDTDNCFDSTTNYRFTPNKSGYYQINVAAELTGTSGNAVQFSIYKNGSPYSKLGHLAETNQGAAGVSGAVLVNFNGSTDYVEVYIYAFTTGGTMDNNSVVNNFNGVWIRS